MTDLTFKNISEENALRLISAARCLGIDTKGLLDTDSIDPIIILENAKVLGLPIDMVKEAWNNALNKKLALKRTSVFTDEMYIYSVLNDYPVKDNPYSLLTLDQFIGKSLNKLSAKLRNNIKNKVKLVLTALCPAQEGSKFVYRMLSFSSIKSVISNTINHCLTNYILDIESFYLGMKVGNKVIDRVYASTTYNYRENPIEFSVSLSDRKWKYHWLDGKTPITDKVK